MASPEIPAPETDQPVAPAKPSNLVGLAILASWVALGAALAFSPVATGPLVFAFVMVGWVLAVMLHEFCHAAVAYLAGDWTVKVKGYLSFDPRRYADLGTSLVIPLLALALGGIGFPGGAVYLRNDMMRSPAWRAAAALAGPGATLAILLALALVLRVWMDVGAQGPLFPALTLLAYLQATALILNLLPIPGLDGFGAIRPFLPRRWAPHIHKLEKFAILALLAAIFLLPGAGQALFAAAADLTRALGLDAEALRWGWRAFHFWR